MMLSNDEYLEILPTRTNQLVYRVQTGVFDDFDSAQVMVQEIEWYIFGTGSRRQMNLGITNRYSK